MMISPSISCWYRALIWSESKRLAQELEHEDAAEHADDGALATEEADAADHDCGDRREKKRRAEVGRADARLRQFDQARRSRYGRAEDIGADADPGRAKPARRDASRSPPSAYRCLPNAVCRATYQQADQKTPIITSSAGTPAHVLI